MSEALICLTGKEGKRRFALAKTLAIGRAPDNDIVLEDPQVSRRHASVERGPRGALLRDLGSGNGTFVGGRRIEQHLLSAGDIIHIGTQELRYEGAPAARVATVTDDTDDATDSGVRFRRTGESGQVEAAKAEDLYRTLFQAGREQQPTADNLTRSKQHLQAIYAANQIVAMEPDLNLIFKQIMEQVFDLVPAQNGVIMLQDENDAEGLTTVFVKAREASGFTVSMTIVQRAHKDREAVLTQDASGDDSFEAGASIITHNIASAMCVPLQHQDEVLGVLYVDTRGHKHAFLKDDLELLVAIAAPAAIAIRNAQYLRQIEQSYEDTLRALSNAIEMRDHYTVGHTWRVTNFALAIARELGWDEDKLRECQMGGVLHDIGKIAVDDAILRKPDRLTEDEYAKMKIHPERGAGLLRDIEFLQPLIPYALYHHERFDGGGYPHGLKGEDIPIEGRVVAVADALDALTSNRPYRRGLPPDKAITEIIEPGRATQFDPDVVDALLRVYKAGKIDRILQDYYRKDEKSVACPYCSTFIRPPEDAGTGDEFECEICHRRMQLLVQNDAYYAKLVTQSGPMDIPSDNRERSRIG